jgi:hypothetical protein
VVTEGVQDAVGARGAAALFRVDGKSEAVSNRRLEFGRKEVQAEALERDYSEPRPGILEGQRS